MKIPDKYKLMPFQETGVEYITSRKYCLLGDDMGLGKSLQALSACVESDAKRILIICPSMIIPQWLELAEEFNIGTNIYYIGKVDAKRPICESFNHWILISSYGFASTNKALRELTYDIVVIDESHALKNPTAMRTKAILGKGSLLKNAARVVLMSGTPVMNRPAELYIMLKTFCPELLGKYIRWDLFVRRYCGFAAKGATHTDELRDILKEFMLRRTKEEVLDQLPPVVEQKIYIEGIKAPDNEYLPTIRRLIAEQKIPYIVEYVKEILQSVEKVLLICYHRDTINEIQNKLNTDGAVTIYGGQNHDLRERNLAMFKTDHNCHVLIGQINTIGFGVDGLQHVCDRIIFAEIDWSPGVLAQAIDRLRRFGQTKTVFVDYLIAKGTLEERIDSKLKWKRKVIKELTETEPMAKPAKTPKVEGLEDAINLLAQLVADKVLAGLAVDVIKKSPAALVDAIASQLLDEPETQPSYILDDTDGLELVGAPVATEVKSTVVTVAPEVSTSADAQVVSAPSEPPSPEVKEVTINEVSDKIYALLEALEDGGVPKQKAMDYYRDQIINGFSAGSVKALKPSELPKVMEKLERIDVKKLISNLKPVEESDGGI